MPKYEISQVCDEPTNKISFPKRSQTDRIESQSSKALSKFPFLTCRARPVNLENYFINVRIIS